MSELENKAGEAPETLENVFAQLDEIINMMEDSSIPLDKAFSLYEEGMKKVKQCKDKLDMVEKQMIVLSQGE